MSTPGNTSIFGSSIIYGQVDYGPTFGKVYRPLNQKRVVTGAGNDIIQPYDVLVVYNKLIPAPFMVQLPDCVKWMSQPYGGFDLVCKDGANNAAAYPISFLPFGNVQTIDAQNAGALPGGAYVLNGNSGSIIFSPLADGSGWVTL